MTRDGERHGAATRESARFSGLRYAPASKAGGFPDAWGSGESHSSLIASFIQSKTGAMGIEMN